jgi:tetratricopeptide (TPR) repeat protein
MIKILAIGLGITLSFGVASAQAKKAPARKTPAHGARSGGKKTAPRSEPSPPDATTDGKAPTGSSEPQPAATPADGKAPETPPDPKGAPATAGGMKTDEKAGTKLEKGNGGKADVSAADEKEALTAFRQGNEFLNNGLFPQSVDKYRNALAHWDHPAIHYNLALALINLDQPLDVYDQLNKAIAYGAEPLEKDKFDHAKEYLKLVEGQLADVEVTCDKIGAKVAVDGKDVFVAPGKYTAKVRVGKHTFFADKQGYNARITAPFIGPGEKFRIELKLYTAEELTRYHRRWQNTWFPYVVAGSGALVGLVAGGMELSAQSSYKDFDRAIAACNTQTGNNAGCPSDTSLNSTKNSGNTKKMIGYVGYGVAGAAVATGLGLAWLNRRQPYQIRAEDLQNEQAEQPGSVSIIPVVAPDMAGAMIMGKF